MKTLWGYALIISLATFIFVLTNTFFGGYLKSSQTLSKEIKTSSDSLYQYKLVSIPPFKYRILFPTLVKATHQTLFNPSNSIDFFRVYRLLSWLFLVLSAISFYHLLSTVGFSTNWAFTGVCIFLFMPPILLAYTVPVHTREDTLGYFLFFTALTYLIKKNVAVFVFIACFGVLCRETLLLLPLIYFFFFGEKNLLKRIFISILPICIWLILRYSLGDQHYDMQEGFRWNISNPVQVLAFVFITFNIGWLPFILSCMGLQIASEKETEGIRLIFRSGILTLTVLFVTTFFGGIFNEIRLLYLFVPWIVIYFLFFLQRYQKQLKGMVLKPFFIGAALIAIPIIFSLTYLAVANQHKFMTAGKYQVPYHIWIVFFILYTAVSIFCVIPFLRVYFDNRLKS